MPEHHGFCFLEPLLPSDAAQKSTQGLVLAAHIEETTALKLKGLVVHLPTPDCGWCVIS